MPLILQFCPNAFATILSDIIKHAILKFKKVLETIWNHEIPHPEEEFINRDIEEFNSENIDASKKRIPVLKQEP